MCRARVAAWAAGLAVLFATSSVPASSSVHRLLLPDDQSSEGWRESPKAALQRLAQLQRCLAELQQWERDVVQMQQELRQHRQWLGD